MPQHLEDEPTSPPAGLLAGRYERLRAIDRGGMAEVWLARDHGEPAFTEDRMVALKILRQELAEDPDALSRFDLEGRSMTKFRHPNIATVFDQVDFGGVHFLVMEYVEGSSLARLIADREEPLPPGDVVEIVSQVCAGIDYAHRNGVIHRDIKPANVLFVGDYDADRPPRVKITDFGIALAKEATRVTRTGSAVGTLGYMAPEVLVGASVTEACDVYACGALLYELLTGRLPYPGAGQGQIAAEQQAGPPPDPAGLVPRLPAGLAQAALVALAYRPDARFLSIGDMWGAIEAGLGGEDIGGFLPTRVVGADGNGPPTAATLYRPVRAPPRRSPPYGPGTWVALVGYCLALGAILLIFLAVVRVAGLIATLPVSIFVAVLVAGVLGLLARRSPLLASDPARREAARRKLGVSLRGLAEAAILVASAVYWAILAVHLLPQIEDVVAKEPTDSHVWLYLACAVAWLLLGAIGLRALRRSQRRLGRMLIVALVLAVAWSAAASVLPRSAEDLARHAWPRPPSPASRVKAETRRWEAMIARPSLRPHHPPAGRLLERLRGSRDHRLKVLRHPAGDRAAARAGTEAWLRSLRGAALRWHQADCRSARARLEVGPRGAKVICP